MEENEQVEEETKPKRIMRHFRENRNTYLAGAAGLAIGAVTATAFVKAPQIKQVVDAYKIQYKSPTTNHVYAELTRRGHPGKIIKCKETGEVFASINRAAEVNKVPVNTIRDQLMGIIDPKSNLTFECLGDMV